MWLGWLPIGLSVPIGVEAERRHAWLDRLRHAVLPALTLSITGVANIALHTREKLVDVLDSDYVLFARARGESRQLRGRRATACATWPCPPSPCSLAPSARLSAARCWWSRCSPTPGLGQAAVTAGLGSDLPLLLGITVITSALVFGGNLAADLLYGLVDPRIRKEVGKR